MKILDNTLSVEDFIRLYESLKDLIILPEYQGQGVGKSLLDHVQKYIENELHDGWETNLALMSAKGKEEFYKKFGFEERPSKYVGAGMVKKINRKLGTVKFGYRTDY